MENNFNSRILIVDDNADLLFAYSNLLNRSGYNVVCAESGNEALELIEKETFSIILLDVMLPDISGLEVLKIIKSDTKHDNVFVVLMSSLATSSVNQSEGLEKGADGYIVTPIQNREFVARVEAFVRHKRTMDKLIASESKYQKLFTLMRLMSDTMPDMLWAKDLNGQFIFTNRAFCKNLLNATDTEEPIGKTDLFFAVRERDSHPDDPDWHTFGELCMDSDATTLSELKEMQFDEFGNIKGKFVFLDAHKAPLYNNDGELIGIVGSARDITSRKLAEEALQKSEEKFKAIANHAASWEAWFSNDGKLLWTNAYSLHLTGYSPEDYITGNFPLSRVIAEEDIATVRSNFNEAIKGSSGDNVEVRALRRDGSKFWISISWRPVLDKNGFSAGFRTSAQDITERKLAEKSLIESEHILRESQAIAKLGSFEWDIKSGFWKSSEILDKIFGIDKQFVRSLEGWASIVHPEWQDYLRDYALNEVVGKQKKFDKEYKILRKDDLQERWVHGLAELEFNSNNEPVKLVGTISDISERKQAEFELKASEENYRTLFEKMSQGVFYQMADGSISAVNDAALHMFGLSREQMMGRTSFDPGWHVTDESGVLLPPEKHPSMLALISGLPCDNRIVGVYNPQQQQFRWLVVNAIPQFDAGEIKPRKVFVTLHDITDRKEAEEALKQKMNELERFNDLTVGRELRMIELKKEINVLLTRSGEKEKYKIVT